MKMSQFAQQLLNYAHLHNDPEILDYQQIINTEPHSNVDLHNQQTDCVVFVTNECSILFPSR